MNCVIGICGFFFSIVMPLRGQSLCIITLLISFSENPEHLIASLYIVELQLSVGLVYSFSLQHLYCLCMLFISNFVVYKHQNDRDDGVHSSSNFVVCKHQIDGDYSVHQTLLCINTRMMKMMVYTLSSNFIVCKHRMIEITVYIKLCFE